MTGFFEANFAAHSSMRTMYAKLFQCALGVRVRMLGDRPIWEWGLLPTFFLSCPDLVSGAEAALP